MKEKDKLHQQKEQITSQPKNNPVYLGAAFFLLFLLSILAWWFYTHSSENAMSLDDEKQNIYAAPNPGQPILGKKMSVQNTADKTLKVFVYLKQTPPDLYQYQDEKLQLWLANIDAFYLKQLQVQQNDNEELEVVWKGNAYQISLANEWKNLDNKKR